MLEKMWIFRNFGKSLVHPKRELPPRDDIALFTKEDSAELV